MDSRVYCAFSQLWFSEKAVNVCQAVKSVNALLIIWSLCNLPSRDSAKCASIIIDEKEEVEEEKMAEMDDAVRITSISSKSISGSSESMNVMNLMNRT